MTTKSTYFGVNLSISNKTNTISAPLAHIYFTQTASE